MQRWLAIIIFAAVSCLSSAAFGHASLIAVDPADGTIVATAPATLDLDFNEQVSPTALSLVTPAGKSIKLTDFRLEQTHVLVPLPSDLDNGTYAFSWRVISADGHPVGGTITFSIGAPSAGNTATAATTADWPLRIGIWTSRVLVYIGLFVGVGGIFFCRWFTNARPGLPWLRTALLLGLVALAASIGFQGLDTLGQPFGNLPSPAIWTAGLASSYGLFVAGAAVALILALIASLPIRLSRLPSLLAFLCIGAALAMTGHASAADPQWLTRPAVFVHTSVVAFWIGALLPLAMLLRGPAADAVAPLRRFSNSIPPLLLVLLAAGTALAVIQVGSPAELLATDYGHVFIAKMAAVALLLGLAAFNRWGLTGTVLADAGTARGHLMRAIAIELGLVFVIFGIVALWRFTPPPRALLASAAPPVLVHISTGDAMAEVTVTPGRVGPVSADIYLMGADMGPLTAKQVTMDFANSEAGLEPIERAAKLGADGIWHVDDLTLPVAGTWQVEIDVLISDFKEIRLQDQIDIAR